MHKLCQRLEDEFMIDDYKCTECNAPKLFKYFYLHQS